MTFLQNFYQTVILPQLGIENYAISWTGDDMLGPDETAHHFTIDGHKFILIFEDFDGLGRSESFIKEHFNLEPSAYEFVPPLGTRDNAPSFTFAPKAPYKYIEGITGTFTLLQLVKPGTTPLRFQESSGMVNTNSAR